MTTRHPASEKKRRQLRKQGDVVSVRDLIPGGMVVGVGAAILVAGPRLLQALLHLFHTLLSNPTPQGVGATMTSLSSLASWLLVFLGLVILGSFLPAWWASGWLWSSARLGGALGPGIQLSFSRAGRELLALTLALGGLIWMRDLAGGLAAWTSPNQAGLQAALWLRESFLLGACLALGSGLIFHWLARRSYEERIQMTDSERRQEAKEDQASPEARAFEQELTARLLGGAAGVPSSGSGGITVMEKPGGGRG